MKEFNVSFNPGEIGEPVKVILQGKDITRKVRTEEIALKSSIIAASSEVREFIRPCQRDFLKSPGLWDKKLWTMGNHCFCGLTDLLECNIQPRTLMI